MQKGVAGPLFSLASCINNFYCSENSMKNNAKFQRKRGGQGPFGPPLNPPLNTLGSAETSDKSLEAVPSILYSANRRHSIFLDNSSFFRLIQEDRMAYLLSHCARRYDVARSVVSNPRNGVTAKREAGNEFLFFF